MRVTIEEGRCIGAGQCVLAAARVFDQREEDGVVVLLDPAPPDEESAAVREAAALCPALAIEVES
ncbi:ferredoxin [Streptosporangium sp. NBC_01639]|uniref:ferredoxin n=1 Tax=Streptosporangium sp. NBC_01639 TaxID=2975948 RepID=UPI0038683A04|nr:ferredoxin [Streptosporangium sp. NBC_01639]